MPSRRDDLGITFPTPKISHAPITRSNHDEIEDTDLRFLPKVAPAGLSQTTTKATTSPRKAPQVTRMRSERKDRTQTRRHASRRKSRPSGGGYRPKITVDTSFGGQARNRIRMNGPQGAQLEGENSSGKFSSNPTGQAAFISLADLEFIDGNRDVPKTRQHTRERSVWRVGKVVNELRKGLPHSRVEALRSEGPGYSHVGRDEGRTDDQRLFGQPAFADGSLSTPEGQPLIDISPSDRPIPIGIFIDPEKVMSIQQTPTSASEGLMYERTPTGLAQKEGEGASTTPTIIITPAREQSGWSLSPNRLAAGNARKARPASSIYSQATPYPQGSINFDVVPPLPSVPWEIVNGNHGGSSDINQSATNQNSISQENDPAPAYESSSPTYARDSVMTAFEEDDDVQPKERVLSTLTTFEEEDTPRPDVARVAKAIGNLKIDTVVTTPRRSLGWWNIITTPFDISRPNTSLSRASPATAERTPELPMLSAAADMGGFAVPGSRSSQDQGVSSFSSPSESLASDQWEYDSPLLGKLLTPSVTQDTPSQPVAQLRSSHDSGARHNAETAQLPSNPIVESTQRIGIGEGYQQPPPERASPQLRAVTHELSPKKHLPTSYRPLPSAIPKNTSPLPHNSPPRKPFHSRNPYNVPHSNSAVLTASSPLSVAPMTAGSQIEPPISEKNVNAHEVQVASYKHTGGNVREKAILPPQSDRGEAAPEPPQHLPVPSTRTPAPALLHSSAVGTGARASPPDFAPPAYTKHPQRTEGSVPYPRPMPRSDFSQLPLPERPHNNNRTGSRWKRWRRKKKCWLMGGVALGFIIIVLAIVIPVMTISRGSKDSEPQSQWLNLTGFPPMPTGVSTVMQPDALIENSGCVFPSTMWSCALPKEQHASVAPNDPNQPNFKLDIQFVNGSLDDSAPSANFPFTPSPDAPSLEDQMFLGNTTDLNETPFEGEETPFIVSFLSPSPVLSRLVKRQTSRDSDDTDNTDDADANEDEEEDEDDSVPDLTNLIPEPEEGSDGLAAAANLVPLPAAQPLRLYNRDQENEHYGFYTYFDRAIFLQSTALLNSSDVDRGEVLEDRNGGSPFSEANVRCTWAQTRFLVQIWTKTDSFRTLLSAPSNNSSSDATEPTATRPGSFPYPVTITLDRHGGTPDEKMLYCYGMDGAGKIVRSNKKFHLETRSFGGNLVNPSKGPFGNVTISKEDGGPGGMDGGTGGCMCQWANWAVGS